MAHTGRGAHHSKGWAAKLEGLKPSVALGMAASCRTLGCVQRKKSEGREARRFALHLLSLRMEEATLAISNGKGFFIVGA